MIITRKHDPIFHIENDNTLRFINIDCIDRSIEPHDCKIYDNKLYGYLSFKLIDDEINDIHIVLKVNMNNHYILKEGATSSKMIDGTDTISLIKYFENKFIDLKKLNADNIIESINFDNNDENSIRFCLTKENLIEMKECINIILDKIKEKL